MMRILISGGAGFIGCHLARTLVRAGYSVRVLDSLQPPVHLADTWPVDLPEEVERQLGDVRDKNAWRKALRNIDAVVHLAAYQDLRMNFSKYFDVNVTGTALLYEVLIEEKLSISKVILASSQAVYGEGRYQCPNASCEGTRTCQTAIRYPKARTNRQLKTGRWELYCPWCAGVLDWLLTDEQVTNPSNQYALSKLAQEQVAQNLGIRFKIPTIVLRYSTVQGPGQSFRNSYSGILRIFSQFVLTGRNVLYYEDGQQLRDYVSVRDVVEATSLALTTEGMDHGVFNVAGQTAISVRQYAEAIIDCSKSISNARGSGLYRYGDVRNIVSDYKTLSDLGWKPKVNLKEIITGYLEWVIEQPDFGDYLTPIEDAMKRDGILRVHN